MYQSTNQRLSRIFEGAGYLNTETTVEIGSEIIYEDVELELSVELRKYIHSHIRFIVPEEVIEKYGNIDRSEVKVLSSPYECGRLLEADHKKKVDGRNKVITMKGIGATGYAAPYLLRKADENSTIGKTSEANELKDWVRTLRVRRHVGSIWGLVGLKEARCEELISRKYDELGVYMQRVLGIYKLCHLPNSKGEFTDVSVLKDLGILLPEFDPAIIVRAMDSNVRILDFLNLFMMRTEALDKLIEEVAGKEIDEYFYDTVRNIVRNNVLCMVAGKSIVSANPSIHARNVSVMGEEIDFETIHDDDLNLPGLPFPKRQTWPGVIRILYYVLKKKKKISFGDSDLDSLVELAIMETLNEIGVSRKRSNLFSLAILNCWKNSYGNDMIDIIRYQEQEKDLIPVDIKATAV